MADLEAAAKNDAVKESDSASANTTKPDNGSKSDDKPAATKSVNITVATPVRLSWLGVFTDLEKMTPMSGFVPYDVNSPLWSDGAIKQRWIAVPTDKQIKFTPTGSWSFPDGTVFMKHFDLVIDETTGERRRLETRFLVRQEGGGVYGVTYKWRRDKSEADMVSQPQTEKIQIKTADGVREQTWYFPSPMDCLVCHNTNGGDVLGVNARQLNGDFKYPARDSASADDCVTDNQLRTWNHLGLFNSPLDESSLSTIPALVRVDDKTASLEARARSYLDANCAVPSAQWRDRLLRCALRNFSQRTRPNQRPCGQKAR